VSKPNDPEDVTELQPADLAEVAVDEIPDELRPQPLEADPADAADQRAEVELEDPVDPDDDI
jgi:hypothetical protein